MPEFRFYHPIEVRYGDLDPQGHVNNSRYLTYFEQARIEYFRSLGLWRSDSFLDIGVIMANASLTFLAPVKFGQPVRAATGVSRLGNKSMTTVFLLEDVQTGQALCTGECTLVTYDYHSEVTIPIPEDWRAKICAFEGLEPSNCDPPDIS
jgi:acyl-CoA thioester hydrolase